MLCVRKISFKPEPPARPVIIGSVILRFVDIKFLWWCGCGLGREETAVEGQFRQGRLHNRVNDFDRDNRNDGSDEEGDELFHGGFCQTRDGPAVDFAFGLPLRPDGRRAYRSHSRRLLIANRCNKLDRNQNFVTGTQRSGFDFRFPRKNPGSKGVSEKNLSQVCQHWNFSESLPRFSIPKMSP